MEPADYLELLEIAGQATGSFAMDGVAILFAYAVAGHFAGKSLSSVQTLALTCVYTIFLLFPVTSAMMSSKRVEIYTNQFRQTYPEVAADHLNASSYSNLHLVLGLVFFASWILSLLYMISVRRTRMERT